MTTIAETFRRELLAEMMAADSAHSRRGGDEEPGAAEAESEAARRHRQALAAATHRVRKGLYRSPPTTAEATSEELRAAIVAAYARLGNMVKVARECRVHTSRVRSVLRAAQTPRHGDHRPTYGQSRFERACDICGATYLARRYDVGKGVGLTCGAKCGCEFRRQRKQRKL